MAAIDDLIAQIEDRALRQRLRTEAARLTKNKKFGLVFEDHLPELTAVHDLPITLGARVARRDRPIHEVWRVLAVDAKKARCLPLSGDDKAEQASFPLDDLVIVRQFGEPIFPALEPVDRVVNGGENDPWHTLIESDNYHALQLLEYCYAGQVDCIYIDPPYNTGARDWKYNNDYVDKNDSWRHSKWLAMMQRRLQIAKRLLNPSTGVLIVTIDEHEVHHLRILLETILPETFLQMTTAVINPKGVTQGRFSRVEEHVLFCFMPNATVTGGDDDLLNPISLSSRPRWKGLLRSGTNAERSDRKKMFYPVLIDEDRGAVVGTGETLEFGKSPDLKEKINGYRAAWPIRSDSSEGNWGVGYPTLRKLIDKGYVRLGAYDKKRGTWALSYLSRQLREKIDSGALIVTDYDAQKNVVDVVYSSSRERKIKTVWHRSRHDAGAHGADLVSRIIGQTRAFSFPKALYSVSDSIACVTKANKNALILDFFAGSGTTLNAVNLLNATDEGKRRCILVTNNEVSASEAERLSKAGLRSGDRDWEKQGICQAVTWPRSKYTILGRRDDSTRLEEEYFTGEQVEKEKPRRFKHLDFFDGASLGTKAKKKRLLALIDALPQNAIVADDQAFIVMADKSASILFDENAAEDWLAALEDQDQITDFYIVAAKANTFRKIRDRVNDLLGASTVTEELKRPMADGFSANLEYFKLNFLDKDQVALGRRFAQILPILWLRAGAIGPRPEMAADAPEPAMLLPPSNSFAVLLDERQFNAFLTKVAERTDLTHVFLITDSPEAFAEMAGAVSNACSQAQVVQLYRDYLENFLINRERRA